MRATVSVGAGTDNAGNGYILDKKVTTKFPLVIVLCCPAEYLEDRGLNLVLEWIPRDQNEEADELSNMDFGRFKEENRVTVDLEAAPFKRLKEMMDRAGKFYEDLVNRRQGKEGEGRQGGPTEEGGQGKKEEAQGEGALVGRVWRLVAAPAVPEGRGEKGQQAWPPGWGTRLDR